MSHLRLLPPLFTLILIVAMAALGWLLPLLRLWQGPVRYVGVIPLAIGVVLNLVSAGMFKRSATTIKPFGDPSALVLGGFYRYTRNPMYLGFLLILLGVGLLLGNAASLLVLPLYVAFITHRYIRHEEQSMEARFGNEYRSYKARVRRWI